MQGILTEGEGSVQCNSYKLVPISYSKNNLNEKVNHTELSTAPRWDCEMLPLQSDITANHHRGDITVNKDA